MVLMMPPAPPYCAEKLEVLTWNWLTAPLAVEYPEPAVPRSLAWKARVGAAPSRVRAFIRGLRPRKLRASRPPASGAAPPASAAKADQCPALLGRLSMNCSSTLLLTAGVRL